MVVIQTTKGACWALLCPLQPLPTRAFLQRPASACSEMGVLWAMSRTADSVVA
eukprot:m.383426 g.383426  ORF g.383426 m.383426 type:complete len:53 (-) comp20046_c1_seq7:163-321(-)